MNQNIIIGFLVAVIITIAALHWRGIKNSNSSRQLLPGQWPDFGLPRGIRNNNPGNIRVGPSPWVGKISYEDNMDSTLVGGQPVRRRAFEQFTQFRYGLRAMIKLLQNYQNNHNLNTLRGILHRYAPTNENHTDIYLSFVSDQVGVGPDAVYPLNKENMRKLVKAIVRYENGTSQAWMTDQDFENAWAIL